MRVVLGPVDFELGDELAAENVFRQHALYGFRNGQFRMRDYSVSERDG